MSTVAQTARGARPRRRAPAKGEPRSRALAGGLLWIVLFGVLLSGVVAVNVAVLRLNLELDRSGRERAELRAEIAGLRSELSSASATARVERLARNELGLELADQDSIIYLNLRP
ncbi:MAG TPA: cell division protein FtsL [Gaiellaceae bacterium]|nr:cell division protein FtsL [Gaiellaceae bacterium]